MTGKNLAVYGAGGHGQVVADCAKATNQWHTIRFFDETMEDNSNLKTLLQMNSQEWEVIIGIGDNQVRLSLKDQISKAGLTFATVVHPKATLGSMVSVGAGSVVMAGAIINVSTKIGEHCIVNTGAQIDHHGSILDGAHIGPGAILAGSVQVGRGSFLGAGSVVIPNIEIDGDVMVAAGAVVTKNVSSNKLVKGVPAK